MDVTEIPSLVNLESSFCRMSDGLLPRKSVGGHVNVAEHV